MKCPKCAHEPTLTEIQNSPDSCPSCGVIYEKYRQAQARPAPADKKTVSKVTRARAAINGEFIDDNAQYVVVTDIRMRFWSMVIFMVKWVLASIPAIIILGVIMMALGSAATGLLRP